MIRPLVVLIPLLLGCSANLQAHTQQDQLRSWPLGSAARLGASSVEMRSDASDDWAPGLPLANPQLVKTLDLGSGPLLVAKAGLGERSNIVKASFLIPLADNHGTPFRAEDFAWLQGELVARFGGWSLEGTVEGAWRGEDGRVYRDRSYRYTVATSALDALRGLLREAKARFGQASLYLEVSETRVEFL